MRKFLTGKQGVITLQAYNLANLNACTTSNVQPCRCAHLQNIKHCRREFRSPTNDSRWFPTVTTGGTLENYQRTFQQSDTE